MKYYFKFVKKPISCDNIDMYSINDKVIHAREGLATIINIASMAGNDYFVIRSDHGGTENIYVPVNNTGSLIRPIMSIEDANKVVEYMKTVKAEFISNTKQRRDQYKRRLLSGNVYDLAYLSRQLYFFHFYNANGQVVKLGPTDIQMLVDAEVILFDELAISFDKPRESIQEYVSRLLA